ncbi:MAG TPA: class I SAM-dependent methyltransferase [Phycisphaerae bacterium]|nr:class I SAM-dependent methyltransferase [Phycisphaerae bacterium]
MSDAIDSPRWLKAQYADGRNVSARADLQSRFSTNPHPWPVWAFDQLELPDRCRILELGCGPAWLWARNLARVPAGWEVTLSDFSTGILDEARQALSAAGRPFSFEVIDAQSIPFDDSSFDAVIANHMLYHVVDLDAALGEIRRVLVPGGRLFAATNGLGHMRELRELVRSVAAEMPMAREGGAANRFGLGNGAELLGAFFEDVELRRYEDALSVPDADPLVAYVLSARDGGDLPAEKVEKLRRRLAEAIAQGGAFHITKSVGMFLAATPA